MKFNQVIIGGIIFILALAALSISGCTSPNNLILEHRQDKTVHDAAENIVLDVSTFNGNIEIRESADYDVEVTYNVTAPQGSLQDVQTGTNGSKEGDTLRIKAEAKLNKPGIVVNTGANILVKVPANSSYNLTLKTDNGDVKVPELNGTGMVIDTSNGNIEITGGNYSTIDAGTSNGDITVKLANGTLFYVDASTSNGRVKHGSIHMTPETEKDNLLKGYTEAGNGSLRMSLHTSNGNIDISYV